MVAAIDDDDEGGGMREGRWIYGRWRKSSVDNVVVLRGDAWGFVLLAMPTLSLCLGLRGEGSVQRTLRIVGTGPSRCSIQPIGNLETKAP